MKKILIALITLIILSTAVAAAPIINVILLNQDPDPVDAGDVVELRFKVENQGETTPSGVKVELVADELEFVDGNIGLPQKPGLGIELNTEAVEKYKVE